MADKEEQEMANAISLGNASPPNRAVMSTSEMDDDGVEIGGLSDNDNENEQKTQTTDDAKVDIVTTGQGGGNGYDGDGDGAGDPNEPNLLDYADAPNIEASNANPEITKESIDLINNNFEKLEKKYGWMYSEWTIYTSFWRFYYILTGALTIFLLLIPLALFVGLLMFLFFIVYILTFRGMCFGKFKNYISFWRTFIGKQRIFLCQTPMKKRGIFWHGWNRIILFYQNYESIFLTGKEGTPFVVVKIYEELFGPTFPFLEGIGISNDYKHSFDEITSLTSQRDGWGVGVQYHEDIEYYCLPHVLSSTDARHLISRDITFMALDFSEMANDKKDLDINLVESIYGKLAALNKNTKTINEAYYPAIMWYYISEGEELSAKDLAFVGNNIAALCITNPRFVSFIMGNDALLRNLYKSVVAYGELFQRLCPKKWAKIEEYCNKHGLKPKYGALIVGINIMFAGGRGGGRKIRKLITNSNDTQPMKMVKLYWETIENDKKNGTTNFTLECLRQKYGIFPTFNLSQKEMKLSISGKNYTFPEKTYISLMQGLINGNNTKYWNEPLEWNPNRNYDKTMLFNTLEMYCPHMNGEKRKNPKTGEEYDVHNISMRYCPGRMLALHVFKHMSTNLMVEAKKEAETGSNEMFNEAVPFREKVRQLFVPVQFMDEKIGANDYQTIVLVRPEAFRMLFYCGFFIMLGTGVALSNIGAALGWNDFSTEHNLIKSRFGANNICIYFDDPPFTYISAAFWVVLLIQVIFYEVTDFFRTHDAFKDGNITSGFYRYYKISTVIELAVFIFFTQSLAVKPDESMYMHTIPYVILIYVFFALCMKRFMYYINTGLTKGYPLRTRVAGYCYATILGLSAFGKTFIILPNLFGARMWETPGLEWTDDLTAVNEPLFSFLVLVCPFIIYWTIDERMQTITVTINRSKMGVKTIAGLKKQLFYMREGARQKLLEFISKPGGIEALSTKEKFQANEQFNKTPQMGPASVDEDLLDAILDEAADNKEERKELSEKYAFLKEKDSYRVFTPEAFGNGSNHNIIRMFEKNEKEKFQSRLWRTVLALLIPLILFPFMLVFKQSVIQMLGFGLLSMFVGYFIHIFSIFGRVARKRRDLANIYRMYSISAICPGWTSMSVAYRVYAFEKHPIASISEFSAIDGGIAQSMLLTISCYSWAVVLSGMAFELEDKINNPDIDDSNNWHDAINWGDILEVFGCFGLVLIGTFDLDPFNPFLQKLHYTGAGLGVGTLLGFFWQQLVMGYYEDEIALYLIFPIIVMTIAVIAFTMWQYYGYVADMYPPLDPRYKHPEKQGCFFRCVYKRLPKPDLTQVTAISMKNVTSEAIFLFSGALCMCLWLVQYHTCHDEKYNYCRLPN